MKKILFILLTYNIIFSSPVTLDKANKVAKNIILERFDNSNSVNLTISSTEIIQSDNIDLIYIFHLDPVGFVLVPADDRAIPVLAYSFESDFIRDDMQKNLLYLISLYESKIIDKIAMGKLNKFINDNTLLNQEWIIEPKKKVKEALKNAAGKDKIEIKKFVRFKVGEGI